MVQYFPGILIIDTEQTQQEINYIIASILYILLDIMEKYQSMVNIMYTAKTWIDIMLELDIILSNTKDFLFQFVRVSIEKKMRG